MSYLTECSLEVIFLAELRSHAVSGEEFSLFCSARGTPRPRIVWTREDEVIKPDKKYQIVSNQTSSKLGRDFFLRILETIFLETFLS